MEIDVEKNSGERLYRELLPTFYWGHAVGKHTLGTYGKVLTTAIDLTTQEIYMLHCWRRIPVMLAASSLAAIKTLTGLKSDTVVYHYTNNSSIVFSSIRRLPAASQPPRVSLVSILNYYAFWSSHVNQVAQFTLSAVWGVQSCTSAYKYSVRLQQCNSPRGLYLEAHYNGFFALCYSLRCSLIPY